MKSDLKHTPRGVLVPGTDLYPESVLNTVSPPPIIYYRGNLSLLKDKLYLSVIGSRAVTAINQRNIHHILDGITNSLVCIISGLALGMDALAHEIALENGLPTIAVLGSSVEPREVYPATNRSLAENILENNGLLISPFPPGTDIMPYNFPIRNQLIAALGKATLVVSAAKKSGALITAKLALEYGNDVFVIPGNSFDPLYEGSNLLLQQGAAPVLNSNDILEYFQLTPGPLKSYTTESAQEQELITLLQQRSQSIQELLIQLDLNSSTLNTLLTKLELKGWIGMGADGMIFLK
jgi:DNA processing protein